MNFAKIDNSPIWTQGIDDYQTYKSSVNSYGTANFTDSHRHIMRKSRNGDAEGLAWKENQC